MKWETPTGCDLRFGFEIMMFIATAERRGHGR